MALTPELIQLLGTRKLWIYPYALHLLPPNSWSTEADCSDSDHLPIIINTPSYSDETRHRKRWIFDQANWNLFEDLTRTTLYPGHSLSVQEFTDKIISAAESSIPRTSDKNGPKSVVWWNENVKAAVKLRRKCLRALRRLDAENPNRALALEQFHKARSACRKQINEAKMSCWEDFVESICPSSQSSQIWNKINRLQGKRKSSTITLNLSEGMTNDGQKVAEALADEYESKSSNSNYPEKFRKQHCKDNKPSTRNQRPNLYKRYNVDFSVEELMWALDRRGGCSTGADNISYVMLQRLPFTSKIALLELFNRIWSNGIYPAIWKLGTVIPIPKPEANRSKPEGYRPITLLSCLGKLFERMVNRRLVTELETTGKLDPRQHAFRAGKGVDTHLARLESLLQLGQDDHAEIVALDIAKAYDTTWRPGILRNLTNWKITGRIMNMVSSFLSDRYFQVASNGHLSSIRKAENGVPQGSVLSVTLFLVAMQPIFDKIPPGADILLYADDVIIIVKGENYSAVRKKLRQAVNAVNDWAVSVGFSIAPAKSKLLHVCCTLHRKRGRAIKINNIPIPMVRRMRILGITVDSKLNFTHHCMDVKKSCGSRMRILRILGCRLKRSSRTTLLNVGSALIFSKLFFGLGFSSSKLETIEQILCPIYNDVVRRASGAFVTSPITSIMAESGCLPFRLSLIQRLSQIAVRLLEKTLKQSTIR